jgi:thiol-disulfide isomerase/thioredoxin
MRKIMSFLALVALSAALLPAESQFPVLPIRSTMPPFELLGVDGQIHHSSDWVTSKVLVVVFTCNHCPTAQLYEDRLKALAADYAHKGVQLVAIQPNNPAAIRLDELGYTDVSDSFPEMKIRAEYRHFNFPYLYDGDTQLVAKQFGPASTPHVFVFDASRHLRYEGRVDNNQRANLVTRQDAREAIDAVLAGRPVSEPHTPSIGCSTKWIYKEAGSHQEAERLAAEPIALTDIDAEGIKKIAQNTGTKITLVDFWATWCAPCVHEMPELVKTWQMYRNRPFDFVTISINYPDERNGVSRALDRFHVTAHNFVFGTMDSYSLMKVFDPDWNGSVPYTALLGPDGKVLWKYQGDVDILPLRRKILAALPDDDYVGQKAYWSSTN